MSEQENGIDPNGRERHKEEQRELARVQEPSVRHPFNHSDAETSKVYTLGMSRVRCQFNPNQNPKITELKVKTAELVDILHAIRKEYGDSAVNEGTRLCNIAMERYEEAGMWAVKAATVKS